MKGEDKTRSRAIKAAKERGDTWTTYVGADGREVIAGEAAVLQLVKAFLGEFEELENRKGFGGPENIERRGRLALAFARIAHEAAWWRAGGNLIDWKRWL